MEFLRKTVKVGNSSGVILPRKLLGSEVRVIVVKRPVNIKREVMKLIDSYLADILGIYITNDSPIEVLAISTSIKELINDEKIKINIVPLSVIKRDIKNLKLKEKIMKAKVILNKHLLFELRKQTS